jgi:hypothetical protein
MGVRIPPGLPIFGSKIHRFSTRKDEGVEKEKEKKGKQKDKQNKDRIEACFEN